MAGIIPSFTENQLSLVWTGMLAQQYLGLCIDQSYNEVRVEVCLFMICLWSSLILQSRRDFRSVFITPDVMALGFSELQWTIVPITRIVSI